MRSRACHRPRCVSLVRSRAYRFNSFSFVSEFYIHRVWVIHGTKLDSEASVNISKVLSVFSQFLVPLPMLWTSIIHLIIAFVRSTRRILIRRQMTFHVFSNLIRRITASWTQFHTVSWLNSMYNRYVIQNFNRHSTTTRKGGQQRTSGYTFLFK